MVAESLAGDLALNGKMRLPNYTVLQGQSWQTGFFELARRDRNMIVRYFWKVVLKF